MSKNEIELTVTAEELRYLISCGIALVQNVPQESLSTYCGFTKDEIIAISTKLKKVADDHGIDM
jgi:hypothetical protein